MKKGIVKEYDPSKGFGFITGDDKEDYFVHVSGLREYLKGRGLRAGVVRLTLPTTKVIQYQQEFIFIALRPFPRYKKALR